MWQQELIKKSFRQKSYQLHSDWRTLDFDYLRSVGVIHKPESDRDDCYFEYDKNIYGEWIQGNRFYVQYSFLYLETLIDEWISYEKDFVKQKDVSKITWHAQWKALVWEYVFGLLQVLYRSEQNDQQYPLFMSIHQIRNYLNEALLHSNILEHEFLEQHICCQFQSKYRNEITSSWKNAKCEVINAWFSEFKQFNDDDWISKKNKKTQWNQFMNSILETWGMSESVWELEVKIAIEIVLQKWNQLMK